MVAKGDWIKGPAIIRQATPTNAHDVKVEKIRALGRAMLAAQQRGCHEVEISGYRIAISKVK